MIEDDANMQILEKRTPRIWNARLIPFNAEQMYATLKALPAKKTQIMQRANLSWNNATELLESAERLGLLRQVHTFGAEIERTNLGDDWINVYEKLVTLSIVDPKGRFVAQNIST